MLSYKSWVIPLHPKGRTAFPNSTLHLTLLPHGGWTGAEDMDLTIWLNSRAPCRVNWSSHWPHRAAQPLPCPLPFLSASQESSLHGG